MQQLWKYVHPQSLTYNFMQDPLLSEEVLLALGSRRTAEDGTRPAAGRLRRVPRPERAQRSRVPAGARGTRDPEDAPNPNGAKALIRHLTGISAQARCSPLTGFFPVVGGRLEADLPGLLAEADAVRSSRRRRTRSRRCSRSDSAPRAATSTRSTATRSRRSSATERTSGASSASRAQLLDQIFVKTNAPCWAPDPPSGRAGAWSSETPRGPGEMTTVARGARRSRVGDGGGRVCRTG